MCFVARKVNYQQLCLLQEHDSISIRTVTPTYHNKLFRHQPTLEELTSLSK